MSPGTKESRLWLALSLGTELVVFVAGGVFLGLWLDRKLHTAPWLMVLGGLAGAAFGLYELIKIAVSSERGRGS